MSETTIYPNAINITFTLAFDGRFLVQVLTLGLLINCGETENPGQEGKLLQTGKSHLSIIFPSTREI